MQHFAVYIDKKEIKEKRMKHRGKRIWSILLTAALICSGFTGAAQAKSAGWDGGWIQDENGIWSYYDKKDGGGYELRKNDFAVSSTDVSDVWTMYYLGEDGHLVLEDGGATVTGPDGKDYELTPGGAVKGGQLGRLSDGDKEWIWYTEPATGVITCQMWWHLEEGDGKYWYYFGNDGNSKSGIGFAYCNMTRRIAGEWYQFDENGHMAENEFVTIFSDGNDVYRAYAQVNGDFAKDKWLFIDGEWYYFKNQDIPDYDSPIPAAVTGTVEIDGKDYEFNENGALISDNAPYRPVDSIELSSGKDSVYVGKRITVKADIQVASDSNASVATMSNAEKKALTGKKAYDAYIQYAGPGISGVSSLDLKDNQLVWTFAPVMEGDVEVRLFVDGVISNTLTISSKLDTDKKGEPGYMADVFAGLMNSELPGEEIVMQLAGKYSELDAETIAKLRNDETILADLEEFEKKYIGGQGMGRYKKELDSIKELADPQNISVVGAYLNADTSAAEPVIFSMEKDMEADVSEIGGNKKVPLDISLTGGNIDSSELEIPITVTMPVPEGLSKEGLKLYHIHNGAISELPLSTAQLSEGKVRFTVSSLSTFVFTNNVADEGGNGGAGGGSGSGGTARSVGIKAIVPETPGFWKQTADGWQFVDMAGTLYSNTWIYVKGKWYWMEATGIMASGWKELNGRKYYLMPATGEMVIGWIADGQNWYYTGTDGTMRTGWIEDGGKWYYLEQDGHMLSSATTPDNYYVDETGVWKEN